MCRIGIAGTQNIGKTTLVKDFLAKWPMYTTPEETYRDVIKKNNLPCNRETTPETQQLIMDHIVAGITPLKRTDNVIFDRTPYDALAYSLYKSLKGDPEFTDDYIYTQMLIAREAARSLDVIFYIPITEKHDIPMVEDELRDTDKEYRAEIDNIFSEMFRVEEGKPSPFFYEEDRTPVIEIFGTPEERIKMIELYITENGGIYGEDQSLIADDDIFVPEEYKK